MVKRFLELLRFDVDGLHKAAYLLAFSSLLSQVLALIRDRLLAHNFGADRTLDLYYAAFRIPDFLLATLGSMVSISVLIPFLIERAATGEKESKRLFQEVFTVFSLCCVALSAALFLLIPLLIPLLFPGFNPGEREAVVTLSRILLLSPFFFGLSNLFASIVQIHQKFFVYALAPLLYNLGIIVGILFLYPLWGLSGLVAGVVLGAFFHMGIQLPTIIERGYLPRLVYIKNWEEIKRVALLSLPRTFALSVSQFVLLFLTALASLGSEGSIAIFSLAFNLQSAPLVIFGVSYATAAFPTLSRYFSEGNREKFLEQMSTAIRHILFWTLPAIALLIVLRAQVVRIVLGSGNFSWADTRLSAAALALFAFSLAAQSLVLLFMRGYYASGNTKQPLIINSIAGGVTILLAYLFLFTPLNTVGGTLAFLLKVDDVAGANVLLLAFSYSLGMCLNLLLFWLSFRRDFTSFGKEVGVTFLHSALASTFAAVVAYYMLYAAAQWFSLDTFVGILLQFIAALSAGLLVWVGVLLLIRNREIVETIELLQNRFGKKVPVLQTTEPELH